MSSFGIVGKLPCRDDFVRVGLEGGAHAFDRWLGRALERSVEALGRPPTEPVRVLFPVPEAGELVVALVAPSSDGVGRTHPVAIFERLPLRDAPRLSALPVATRPFFAAALDLAADAGPFDGLAARLARLPATTEPSLHRATMVCDATLRGERLVDFERRVFADPAAERHYAYHTLLSAAGPLAGAPLDKPGPVLGCPVTIDVDQFVWLEGLQRVLGASPVSVLWSEDEEVRMLVSLGPLPERALVAFEGAAASATFLWPLTSDRPDARHEAHGRLGAALGSEAPEGVSIGTLIEELARLAPSYAS